MDRPLLLVVAGPPGAGKTTLSVALGAALGLPVVCRDAIKEGVAYTTGETVQQGSPEAARMFDLFYDVVDGLLDRGVSVIAEAAFRADIAPAELLARRPRADIMVVRCVAPATVWFARFRQRGPRPGHRDDQFVARTMAEGGPDSSRYLLTIPDTPTIDVDTTAGYEPGIEAVVDFVRRNQEGSSEVSV